MIGGTDIVIPTSAGVAALEMALRFANRIWPQAVFEDAATGKQFARYSELALEDVHELLVYENPNAAKGWEELGADESLAGTLIHLLLSSSSLSIVIDDPPTELLQKYVSTVRAALMKSVLADFGR